MFFKKLKEHSKISDKQAISFHYDVPDEYYSLVLGSNMVYSCAYFRSEKDTLYDAQQNKLDLISRKLRLKTDENFLDIGCGWGALVTHAAKFYGVSAYGITLSKKQFDFASQKILKEKLSGTCSVELKDYRELEGRHVFEKVASIGMFEHVGVKNLGVYFKIVRRVLKNDGLFLNHGITNKKGKLVPSDKFTRKYIFPDGELTTLDNVIRIMRLSGFDIIDVESLRLHYARTLELWVKNMEENKASLIELIGEEKFRARLIHLAGSSASFRKGETDVFQILASPEGVDNIPENREDIYHL